MGITVNPFWNIFLIKLLICSKMGESEEIIVILMCEKINKKISKRIVELRKGKNLSQSDLSNTLSISRTTLAHYEVGDRAMPYECLVQIANFFDVSIDYLMGLTEFKEGTKAYNKKFLGDITYAVLCKNLSELEIKHREAINNIVDLISAK